MIIKNLLALVIFLSSSTSLCLSYEPRNHEVVALISLKESLTDPHGVLNNWDGDSVDPCSWTMITCSPENLVVGLGAPSQSLSGTLSAAIGNLTSLRQVLLQNNNVSGKLPAELGQLRKLQTLDLSNNRFSGVVPDSLGQLNSLQYLDLSYNNLSGPIPKFPARTFNVAGNPLICESSSTEGCSGSSPVTFPMSLKPSPGKHNSKTVAIALGVSLSCAFLMLLSLGILWYRKKQKSQTITNISNIQEEGLVSLGNLRNFAFKELQ